jgi:hypothetical protein
MNRFRYAPFLVLLLGVLPGFATSRLQKIAPKNRFQYTPPEVWAKAAKHASAATKPAQPGKAAKLASRAPIAKNAKETFPGFCSSLPPTLNPPTGISGSATDPCRRRHLLLGSDVQWRFQWRRKAGFDHAGRE